MAPRKIVPDICGPTAVNSHAEPVVVDVREPDVPADVDSVEHLRVGFILAVPANLDDAKSATSTVAGGRAKGGGGRRNRDSRMTNFCLGFTARKTRNCLQKLLLCHRRSTVESPRPF